MFYGKWPSGHFAWICLPTQERANKAKHGQLVFYLGQYWLLGIDHWLTESVVYRLVTKLGLPIGKATKILGLTPDPWSATKLSH